MATTPIKHIHHLLGALALVTATMLLSGCFESLKTKTVNPDYRIMVMPSTAEEGTFVAVPPTCADWRTYIVSPVDNQPIPSLGCANARNLAMMVEDPEDLIDGGELGPTDAKKAANSVLRYRWDVPYGLHDPTSPPNSILPDPTVEKTP
ncbi:MAG: hypothetical protein GC131_05960 [Alphaproteobacteria bacterium]|nr:hypothetical protein [Alphaproteobacteria bacterium]